MTCQEVCVVTQPQGQFASHMIVVAEGYHDLERFARA